MGLLPLAASLTKTPLLGCTFWAELDSPRSSWLAIRKGRGDDELSTSEQEDFNQLSLKAADGVGPPQSWAGPLKARRGFPWLGHEGRGLPRQMYPLRPALLRTGGAWQDLAFSCR